MMWFTFCAPLLQYPVKIQQEFKIVRNKQQKYCCSFITAMFTAKTRRAWFPGNYVCCHEIQKPQRPNDSLFIHAHDYGKLLLIRCSFSKCLAVYWSFCMMNTGIIVIVGHEKIYSLVRKQVIWLLKSISHEKGTKNSRTVIKKQRQYGTIVMKNWWKDKVDEKTKQKLC